MTAVEVNVGMRNWELADSLMGDLRMWDDTKVLPIDGFRFYVVTHHWEELVEHIERCCPEAEIKTL